MKDLKHFLTLSLDTSSQNASIAILGDEDLLAEYNFLSRDELSSSLIGIIRFVLNSTKIKLEDINLFSAILGPGLFTGIRVGLSTVKGLVFDQKIPLAGISSLEAMACKFLETGKTIIPLIDARRDEVYYAGYRDSKEILASGLCNYQEIPERIIDFSNILLVGNGASKYSEFFKRKLPHSLISQRGGPIAFEAGLIAYRKFRNNSLSGQEELLPLYIRKPDALLTK
jgi:tRNA threonylcarbamoyl adenosine modification protein YeaZ